MFLQGVHSPQFISYCGFRNGNAKNFHKIQNISFILKACGPTRYKIIVGTVIVIEIEWTYT